MKMGCYLFAGLRPGLLAFCMVATATASPSRSEVEELSKYQMLLNFSGKGTSLAYDAGVVDELFNRVPALAENKVMVAGSSSGGVTTLFFGCRGFSKESIAELNAKLAIGTPRIRSSVKELRRTAEDYTAKARLLMSGKVLGVDVQGVGIDNMDAYIDAVLGLPDPAAGGAPSYRSQPEQSPCYDAATKKLKFKIPFMVVAANKEVLDNRHEKFAVPFSLVALESSGLVREDKVLDLQKRSDKEYDLLDYSVYWKTEALKGYLAKPQLFNRINPALKLPEPAADDPHYIGKACTYFVSPDLFEAFSGLRWKDLLCDVRKVDTIAALALAIGGTAAEPTYFAPQLDDAIQELSVAGVLGSLGNSLKRFYWGGLIMPLAAQDLRRLLPALRVVGTGWFRLPNLARSVMSSLILVNTKKIEGRTSYWADLEVTPDAAAAKMIKNKDGSSQQEFAAGKALTAQCLKWELEIRAKEGKIPTTLKGRPKVCLPRSVTVPKEASPLEETTEGELARDFRQRLTVSRDFTLPHRDFIVADGVTDEKGEPYAATKSLKGGRGLGALLPK